jgi:hypothetical protein
MQVLLLRPDTTNQRLLAVAGLHKAVVGLPHALQAALLSATCSRALRHQSTT